jgi:recombination protein RecT
MLGYRGMIVLALRNKDVKIVTSTAVFKGDFFDHGENQDGQYFDYKPCGNKNPEELEKVFAVGRMRDSVIIDVMERAEIEAARRKSQMPNGPAWRDNYAEMARKTAIRRLFKYLPLEPEALEAIAKDDERWSDLEEKREPGKYVKALEQAEKLRIEDISVEDSPKRDIIVEKHGDVAGGAK